MVLNSYAKLNLYLAVLNKRKDKYHNIKTLFERISLADKITLKTRRDNKIKIISHSSEIPRNNSNFAFQAAKLLKDSLGIKQGVNIKIVKYIPVGSGMGGGSSNAATVLSGLNKLWNLRLSKGKLAKLAAKIGSDAPFFIYESPFALGAGRGEKIKCLRQLSSVNLWHILVVPRIKVSTPYIYKKWDDYSRNKKLALTRRCANVKMVKSLKRGISSLRPEFLYNSLQAVTCKVYPEVKRVYDRLAGLGLKSILMSGSGPAVMGIVSSRKEAVAVARQVKRENRSWQVFVTSTH